MEIDSAVVYRRDQQGCSAKLIMPQTKEASSMATVGVHYIVDDVDAAITFYTQYLGFNVEMHPAGNCIELSQPYT